LKASLRHYRHKRDFQRTSEPKGSSSKRKPSVLSYVIQKHAARRLHYDFRLELDGVLKSWAVPKGPSYDSAVKALAVHVEDHPLEYGSFEGTIPAGQYGGGTVMLWDRGTWTPIGDPHQGFEAGKLEFRLDGERLNGVWKLIRMSGRAGEDGKNWLLMKRKDEDAKTTKHQSIIEKFQTSVTTGRTMDEIAAGKDASHRNGRANGKAQEPAKPKLTDISTITGARERPTPASIKPQLATLAEKIPDGDDWLHELKLDGYRIISIKRAGEVSLITRRGQVWTERFPTVAEAVAKLPVTDAILDGEIVVLTADGTSDFQALQNSLRAKRSKDHVYFIFDLPYCEGYDLTRVPLHRRKELLASVLSKQSRTGPLRFSDHIRGHGPDVIRQACRHSLEGTVSKHADSPYVSARSREWIKVKCRKRQEFVVGGWTDPEGSRTHFGALLLGWYDGSTLRYCGRVGSGFSAASRAELSVELQKLNIRTPSFSDPPPRSRSIHWVKPELVVEVEFANWTNDGILRQATFLGLREDKRPTDITRENPVSAPNPAPVKKTKVRSPSAGTKDRPYAGVRFTNLDRVLFPDENLTKKDLAEYYTAVAESMLPYVVERPLTVVRCPQGHQGQCFFQRHVTASVPKHVHSIPVEEKDGIEQCLSIRDLSGLMALVQFNSLEIHVWGSRQEDIERPDRIVLDLDPDAAVQWSAVIKAARELRTRLQKMNLESFVRTTGGKGLHLVVPIIPEHDWPTVKRFAKGIADDMAREEPNRFIATASKARRAGKIYVDYLRNERGATAIANYSTRARKGATVATPIRWEELTPRLKPAAFTVLTVPRRLARMSKDPWEGFFTMRQSLPASE
jgi:bifunctional non-homologous end joining protein LigD